MSNVWSHEWLLFQTWSRIQPEAFRNKLFLLACLRWSPGESRQVSQDLSWFWMVIIIIVLWLSFYPGKVLWTNWRRICLTLKRESASHLSVLNWSGLWYKWCEALSCIIVSRVAFGWLWGSPRWCMILTLWPDTFDRNTRQINKFSEEDSELC